VTYGGRKRRTTHESDPSASLWVYAARATPAAAATTRSADAFRVPTPRHFLVSCLPQRHATEATWMGVEYSRTVSMDSEQKPMYEMSRKAFESQGFKGRILNY